MLVLLTGRERTEDGQSRPPRVAGLQAYAVAPIAAGASILEAVRAESSPGSETRSRHNWRPRHNHALRQARWQNVRRDERYRSTPLTWTQTVPHCGAIGGFGG